MQGTLHDVPSTNTTVQLRYSLGAVSDSWVLTEGNVPESTLHDRVAQRLKLLLEAWAARTHRSVGIARNLAVRWLERDPRVGIDPDVCVLEPAPEGGDITSLWLWQPGHVAPPLCFEIVSANHPHKDYREIQDRYAAMGTTELIVFDPLLAGPKALGGPVMLQRWVRHGGLFERDEFGDDPVHSAVLGAWLLGKGDRLDIFDVRQGSRVWQTEAEQTATVALAEREEKERERALRQGLEREIADLRAKRADG
jgi:hypothetical protein